MNTIDEYFEEFRQYILARSSAGEDFYARTFTERMCEILDDQGVVGSDVQIVTFKKESQGTKVDAWQFNGETNCLSLCVSDYRSGSKLETLTQSDIDRFLGRLTKFIKQCSSTPYFESLDESTATYPLARMLFKKEFPFSKFQLLLLSNTQLSNRVSGVSDTQLGDVACSFDVWDIGRLYRLDMSGRAREDMEIKCVEYIPNGIPCLPVSTNAGVCESYLFVMPGEVLADLYERYNERLLEQNVRTFLQFRGNVNKGIRNTILNTPNMFFSYNNGIAATAESVLTNADKTRILSIKNFQIVNGGQTTASIYTAKKNNRGANLAEVAVQVKLSVIPEDRIEDIVPKISQFANTQNKVTAADFFSNAPFHLRMQEISRRLWAKSASGSMTQTHWFYERTRGQFANAQAKLTPAKAREFLVQNPRTQMFDKEALAKYETSFEMQPWIVSLGRQKCFAQYANQVGLRWTQDEKQFNDFFFKCAVAKKIIFDYLDKDIPRQPWYAEYKAQIVTYTIAKLAKIVADLGQSLDYEHIWNQQNLSNALKTQLIQIAKVVAESIQQMPEGTSNVGEWCKKKGCWQRLDGIAINIDSALKSELVDISSIVELQDAAKKTQQMQNGLVAQVQVVTKGSEYWKSILDFMSKIQALSPKETDILALAAAPNRIPSEKQSQVLLGVMNRAFEEGYPEDGSMP